MAVRLLLDPRVDPDRPVLTVLVSVWVTTIVFLPGVIVVPSPPGVGLGSAVPSGPAGSGLVVTTTCTCSGPRDEPNGLRISMLKDGKKVTSPAPARPTRLAPNSARVLWVLAGA